jgi:Methyltransferase domain
MVSLVSRATARLWDAPNARNRSAAFAISNHLLIFARNFWPPACPKCPEPIPVPLENPIPFPEPASRSARSRAVILFQEGRVVEAATLLSSAILEGESADLWNDWAVVQLSVAERALRRALLLAPAHHDATANLGVLLFSLGRRADAAGFLCQALTATAGAKHDYVNSLLKLCEAQPAPLAAPPPKQITDGYTFTADWFSGNNPSFWKHLKALQGTACSILEIGCFEGRASTWLLQNIATSPDSHLLCLDCNDQPLFAANIRQAGGEKRTEFRRGISRETLRTLPFASCDFIYIDGSHGSTDVLEDAVQSFRLAKPGAIIAFDDYLWNDPQHNQEGVPKPAIDAFLTLYAQKIQLLESGYQVWLRKLTD